MAGIGIQEVHKGQEVRQEISRDYRLVVKIGSYLLPAIVCCRQGGSQIGFVGHVKRAKDIGFAFIGVGPSFTGLESHNGHAIVMRRRRAACYVRGPEVESIDTVLLQETILKGVNDENIDGFGEVGSVGQKVFLVKGINSIISLHIELHVLDIKGNFSAVSVAPIGMVVTSNGDATVVFSPLRPNGGTRRG